MSVLPSRSRCSTWPCSFQDIATCHPAVTLWVRSTMTKKRASRSPHSPPDARPLAGARATADEANTLRRAAEELRETAEGRRQEQEAAREAAETTRAAGEGRRLAAEDARHALVDSIQQTAASLQATLERMTTVEEMRRAFHEMRTPGKLPSH